MITQNLLLSHFLIYLFMLSANPSFSQITNWQVDPTHNTQYLVPQNWIVNAGQQQGMYLWQAAENPGNPIGAEITIISMPDFGESSPDFFLTELKNTIQGFTITETQQVSVDEYHYRAVGQVEGTQIQSNIIFLRDRSSRLLFLASFSAEARYYDKLGGTSVLYQSLQRPNPFKIGPTPKMSPSPKPNLGSEPWNMQSLEVQNYLKMQGVTPRIEDLLGEWLQVFSYQTGTSAQDLVSGQIAFGERGYGHLFTFKTDNTYRLTYKYNSVNQGCAYQADMVEKGRFKISGRQLILYPDQYKGTYNLCNKTSPEINTNPPTRYFDLFMDQDRKRLLIMGQALEYSISSETDANGRSYIQEGFNKTR